ncbi:MAG: GNAT family N-acetyltransferase [Cyclobacteriaceae bacterium]
MDLDKVKTRINQEEHRFELSIEGQLAKIDFKEGRQGWFYMVHTEVPTGLEGRGVGHKLVRESLDWIEKNHRKIIPLCPFVRSYVLDNLEDYREIIAEGAKL